MATDGGNIIRLKRKDLANAKLTLQTGVSTRVVISAPTVGVLDAEDEHFHFNRSVLLPDLSSHDGGTPVLYTRRVTGLGVIFAALVHADKHQDQGLFVSGHTDPSGDASYNLKLSSERAKNVSLLLRGKRDDWRKQAAQDDNVDDYQRVLKWQAERAGWDCDPGDVDNKLGTGTKKAIKSFQTLYNQEVDDAQQAGKDSPFKAKIGTDGTVGPETWGAFYDLYMDELMLLLELDKYADLQQRQAALKAPSGMPDFVGCGEHVPFVAARRNPPDKGTDENTEGPQRNPADRRVEILFFDPGEEVKLDCHPSATVCKPDQCPVYFKQPLLKQDPLFIPPGLNITEVNLRLSFVDPEGKVRPFPEGLPVAAEFGDPSSPDFIGDESGAKIGDPDETDNPQPEADAGDDDPDADSEMTDQEPTVPVGPNGVVRLVIPRRAKTFYLRVAPGSDKRFITCDPKVVGDSKLAGADEARAAVGQGRVFLQLPAEFDSGQGYWKAPADVKFKDGMFQGLDDKSTEIGTREAPAEMQLQVHWQFFRFEYFDRWTSSPAVVPQPRSKDAAGADVPPLVLEGFPNTLDPTNPPPDSESGSAWDVVSSGKTVHCLGWVRQLRDPGGGSPHVMPAPESTTIFQVKSGIDLFVRTEGDGSSPNAQRNFVAFSPGDAAPSTAGAERMRLYDLPRAWWSVDYPAHMDGEDVDKNKPFQQLASTASTLSKPYVVSLDVVVLENDTGDGADTNVVWDDTKIERRIGIYDNQLQVYKPDSSSGETYFTRLADLKKQPDGPVLHDVPPFTRLIARGAILFDVFHERTRRIAGFKGFPVGARLASRYTQGIRQDFFLISESPYSVPEPSGSSPGGNSIPATITALLRCCGHDGNKELFMVFQYMSVSFDFSPAPPLPGGATALTSPPTGTDADNKSRDCLLKVIQRWNANPVIFHIDPSSTETAHGRYLVLVNRGAPPPASGPDPGQVKINIYQTLRASQNGSTGTWEIGDMSIEDGDRFTAAHELGHAMSQPDEYHNTDYEPALGQIHITEAGRSPGSPYGFDGDAMMVANKVVRTRYFWHLILWARQLNFFNAAKDVTIELGPQRFSADLTPRNQNRVSFPMTPLLNATPDPAVPPNPRGQNGLCDLFMYVTGHDGFTTGALGGSSLANPYDGFITVRVKMAWTFNNSTKFDDMSSRLSRAAGILHQTFNIDRRLAVRGVVGGKPVRLRVLFCPRFICRTFPTGSGSNNYLQTIDFPKLNPINVGNYNTRVGTGVTRAGGVHAEITMVDNSSATTGIAPGGANPRTATVRQDGFFSSRFDDDVMRFFSQLVGLKDENFKGVADYAPLFVPFAPGVVLVPEPAS